MRSPPSRRILLEDEVTRKQELVNGLGERRDSMKCSTSSSRTANGPMKSRRGKETERYSHGLYDQGAEHSLIVKEGTNTHAKGRRQAHCSFFWAVPHPSLPRNRIYAQTRIPVKEPDGVSGHCKLVALPA